MEEAAKKKKKEIRKRVVAWQYCTLARSTPLYPLRILFFCAAVAGTSQIPCS